MRCHKSASLSQHDFLTGSRRQPPSAPTNGNSTVDLLLIAPLLPLRNLVESSCVAAENSRLVFVAETRVFLHLFNFVQDIFRPDLVGKVARKKEVGVSRPPDLIIQPL